MAAKSQFKNLSGFNKEKDKSGGIFGQAVISDINDDEEKYLFERIDIEDIICDEKTEYDDDLYESVKQSGIVSPIWLSFDYVDAEKAGRKYKKKTGKYHIIDGNKRVAAANKILSKEDNSRLRKLQALILPIDTSEAEIEEIKKTVRAKENQNRSTVDLISIVNSSKGAQITYGYKYENADIPFDLIHERDNKYPATEAEIEALADSIYKYGLFQDIMVLPEVNQDTMQVTYRLEAGHKRRKAIKLLLDKAKAGQLEKGKTIIANYSKIPAKILPLGATNEQIEAVYNESNIHSRKMTTDSFFAHLSYFSSYVIDENTKDEYEKYLIPKIPTSRKEYLTFIENVSINALIPRVQGELKKLGFADWKNRKMTQYLNIYYFGCDKLKDMCIELTQHPDKRQPITLGDMAWIATTFKDWDKRGQQEDVIEKALQDKTYIPSIKDKTVSKTRTVRYTSQQVAKKILKDSQSLENVAFAEIVDSVSAKEDYDKILKSIGNMKNSLKKIEKRFKELSEEQDK